MVLNASKLPCFQLLFLFAASYISILYKFKQTQPKRRTRKLYTCPASYYDYYYYLLQPVILVF